MSIKKRAKIGLNCEFCFSCLRIVYFENDIERLPSLGLTARNRTATNANLPRRRGKGKDASCELCGVKQVVVALVEVTLPGRVGFGRICRFPIDLGHVSRNKIRQDSRLRCNCGISNFPASSARKKVLKSAASHRRRERTNVAFLQLKDSQLPPALREKCTRILNPSRKTKPPRSVKRERNRSQNWQIEC